MTFPATDRLTTQVLIDWFKPQLKSEARLFAGREPDMGRVITISMGQGFGPTMDGILDTPGFQVRCRGAENNLADAENIAMEIDSVIMRAPTSFFIGDVYVDYLGRSGGAPQQLAMNDSLSRFTFTCSYFASVDLNLQGG